MARYGTVKQQMKDLTLLSAQQPQEIRERRTAAEGVLGALNADIGKAGTYDLPAGVEGTDPGPTPPIEGETGLVSKDGYKFANSGTVAKYDKLIAQGYSKEEATDQLGAQKGYVEDSIFKSTKTGSPLTSLGGKTKQRTVQLDKDAALGQIESSSAFRQVSRMMAESEQMLARKGPLYDEMMRSTQLPIIEASASAARENTENIRRAMARGGSARRDAFEAITKIRSQENLNMQRGQALAKAHLEMDLWARNNAKEVMNFSNGWATNQAGIRESYQSAMDNATSLMSTSSIPFIFAGVQKEQEYRDAASAQSRGKVMKQINGVLGIVGSIAGIVGAVYGGKGPGKTIAETQAVTEGKRVGSTGYAATALPTRADNESSNNYFGGGGQK